MRYGQCPFCKGASKAVLVLKAGHTVNERMWDNPELANTKQQFPHDQVYTPHRDDRASKLTRRSRCGFPPSDTDESADAQSLEGGFGGVFGGGDGARTPTATPAAAERDGGRPPRRRLLRQLLIRELS